VNRTDAQPLADEIINNVPDAVIYADSTGRIQFWSPGAAALFGYTAEEAIGQSLDLIIPERLQQRHWDGFHRVMQSGETRYGPGEMLSVPAMRRDGTRMSVEFSIGMRHDAEGRIEGIAAIMRDVTARWQQERELRARLAALEKEHGSASPASTE